MNDAIWKRDELDSPCINICVIHPKARICIGCFRTGDEIARWSAMTPEQRQELKAELPQREPQLATKRRGRAKRLADPPKL
ncbi:MAG: DUF1289 domain-containing protein [Paracoccaceae bacterium]